MSERSDLLLVEDILTSVEFIFSFTELLSLEQFLNDRKTQDAVCRNFEIIGEASNKISQQVISENPGIEWSAMISFRNKVIHDYFGVDNVMMWNIIKQRLPILLPKIQSLQFALSNKNQSK
jgi:uncharacterized protein with HEPN domain